MIPYSSLSSALFIITALGLLKNVEMNTKKLEFKC